MQQPLRAHDSTLQPPYKLEGPHLINRARCTPSVLYLSMPPKSEPTCMGMQTVCAMLDAGWPALSYYLVRGSMWWMWWMWWSSEHGGYGRCLDAADAVGLVDMADMVEGSLGIWESSMGCL